MAVGFLMSLAIARVLRYPVAVSGLGLPVAFVASALSGIVAEIYFSFKATQIHRWTSSGRYRAGKQELKLSAASCGESSILNKEQTISFCSLTPRQAAGNKLAGGFKR
jgi:hypothetical protein